MAASKYYVGAVEPLSDAKPAWHSFGENERGLAGASSVSVLGGRWYLIHVEVGSYNMTSFEADMPFFSALSCSSLGVGSTCRCTGEVPYYIGTVCIGTEAVKYVSVIGRI